MPLTAPESRIATPRLVLLPIAENDVEDYVRLCSDEAVMRFIGDGRPAAAAATQAWVERALAHWQTHGFGHWTVRLRGTGEFAGRCGLVVQQLEHGSEIELGYVFAAQHWQRGYATEAALAVRDYAVTERGLHRLIGLIDRDNEASRRVATKLGLRFERQVRFGKRWTVLNQMVDLYAG